ncbi:MAG: tRNA preQ1(34) S-adenosylmethionine ribosyltransferase-isomerase QueA [Puniceicoccales bacterium]|jgi:S-adenosylmethionine:tRNA ribosyltransferase-isomerase|nr:tRNA preQ1(34) S-adenosylmethionine ribosyltransferase-isomerase QueA [Puniceicoccales bacterium]
MDSALFDYSLPEACIAHTPASRRDESRLLVVERSTQSVSHHVFRELPELLPAGVTLFRNNARVLRARLPGVRPTGGKVECLLLRPAASPEEWWCLLKPGKKAADGTGFGWPGVYHAQVVGTQDVEYRVRFTFAEAGATVLSVAEKIGALPLPPYIERARKAEGGGDYAALDKERYQTVYADPRRTVAAAAPTAGLHFSPEVLAALVARGVASYDLTLHIGLGTFQPMKVERVEEHVIHRECYEISAATRAALASARPRLAVGTTSLRAMEDFSRKVASGAVQPDAAGGYAGEAGLFIYPPAAFSGAELLLTNFHLPRSTLMCLVAAFLTPDATGGIVWLKELYAEAVAHGYRFYSYGDAMLIL